MERLNLIRVKIQEMRQRRNILRCFLGAYIVLAAIFAGGMVRFMMTGTRIVQLKSEIDRVTSDIEKVKREQGTAALEKEWTVLAGRLNSARQMYEQKSNWARKLRDISALLPKGICIKDITTQEGLKTTTLSLIVVPMAKQEYEEVNDYISALENRSGFGKGIRLESHERSKIDGRGVELFGLLLPGKKEQ